MDPMEISDEQQMENLLSDLQNLHLETPRNPIAPRIPRTPMAPATTSPPVASGTQGLPVEQGVQEAVGALDVAAALVPRRPEQTYQQYFENIAETSEFNVIDVEVVAAELCYAIEQMSWRHNRLEEEYCPLPINFLNVIPIMEQRHNNNHVMSQESMVQLWSRYSRTPTLSQDTLKSSLAVLLKCTTCSVIISTLYENLNPDLYNSNRQVRMIGSSILNEADFLQLLESCIKNQCPTSQIVTHHEKLRCIRPSSPLPSTTNCHFLDQPSSSKCVRITSPILNLPSTSKRVRFVFADQKSSSLSSSTEDDQEMKSVGDHQLSVKSNNKKLSVDTENKVETKKDENIQNGHGRRKKLVKRKNERRNQRNLRK